MATIIGAGIIGVMTAYHLAQAGRRVTIVDRAAAPASECSWGNAGVIALGHAEAWAGPNAPRQILRALAGRDPSVRVRRPFDPALWRWGLAFLGECSAAAQARNTDRLARLSLLGREVLQEVEAAEGIDYHQRHDGAFYLFTDRDQYRQRVDHADGANDILPMTPQELQDADPGLAAFDDLAGGFLSMIDSRGSCPDFARQIAHLLEECGVQFLMGRNVTGLAVESGRVARIETDMGDIRCAGPVILAAGSATPRLARSVGVRPLIYPVKGYSGTYRIRDPERIPQRSFVDETALVGVSKLGPDLRITARAEFDGHDTRIPQAARDTLDRYAARFGDAIEREGAVYWAGLRPSTPTGAPYLGRITAVRDLWINAGHGQLGWTMAAGAGRVLSDMIEGRRPSLSDVSQPASWLETL